MVAVLSDFLPSFSSRLSSVREGLAARVLESSVGVHEALGSASATLESVGRSLTRDPSACILGLELLFRPWSGTMSNFGFLNLGPGA